LRWEGHVERIGEKGNAHKDLHGKPKVGNYSEKLGVDGRIIL
jgi:hypothetical protein